MAITKTDFINYTRCPKYSSLEDIRKDKLESKISIEEYKKQETNESINEMLSGMFDENDNDKTQKINKQLEAMMDYYKEVEILAAQKVNRLFGGKSVFSDKTYNQESFDFELNGIRYLCYVDVFNETSECINIVEVKATTSKTMLESTYGKENYELFVEEKGIYKIGKCKDKKYIKQYENKINSFKDRYKNGKYIYDLAVQRYFIENDFKKNSINKKVNFYLAVLNHRYTYDGYKENGKTVYRTDELGNDIISLFDMNDITLSMMNQIDYDRINLEKYVFEGSHSYDKFGVSCELKKNTECKYTCVCMKEVPKENSSLSYKRFISIKDLNGNVYNKYDLLNNHYYKLDDIPEKWLKNINHIIQRQCYENNTIHINKEKIVSILNDIKYPIYHLDFETFPCPLPRFKGENPYTQSPFEFSLHIERSPGVCDKEKDNFIFLASTLEDERLALTEALIKNIDCSHGTMLAQNVSFERMVIKKLSDIFPQYKKELLRIVENSTDLLYFLDTNYEYYKAKGFSEEESKTMNYYNSKQSGSFSIKKTLPLFTSLSYKDLEIQNGTEALCIYSNYYKMSQKELLKSQDNLREYCKQDTWAMVEILNGLRNLVK